MIPVLWGASGAFYVFMFGFTKAVIGDSTSEWRANAGAVVWPLFFIALAGTALAKWLISPRRGTSSSE